MNSSSATSPAQGWDVATDETWTHPLVARWMFESAKSDAAGIAG